MEKRSTMGELRVAVGMFLGLLVDTLGIYGPPWTSSQGHQGDTGGHHGVGQGSNLQLLQVGLPARCLLIMSRA